MVNSEYSNFNPVGNGIAHLVRCYLLFTLMICQNRW